MNPNKTIPTPTAAIGTTVSGARPVEGVELELALALELGEDEPVGVDDPVSDLSVDCAPAYSLFREVYSALRLLASDPVAVAAS